MCTPANNLLLLHLIKREHTTVAMEELYALFIRSITTKPVSYRLGSIYTVKDVVRLLAKAHSIILTKHINVALSYNTNAITISYTTTAKTVRIIDGLYVLDKLLSKHFILQEEPPLLTTIPGDLQRIIFSVEPSTLVTAQHISKTTKTATTVPYIKLCGARIKTAELVKWYNSVRHIKYNIFSMKENTTTKVVVTIWEGSSYSLDGNTFILNKNTGIITKHFIQQVIPELNATKLATYYSETNSGTILDLYTQYKLYNRRLSCVKANADYAKEYVVKFLQDYATQGTSTDAPTLFIAYMLIYATILAIPEEIVYKSVLLQPLQNINISSPNIVNTIQLLYTKVIEWLQLR